MQKMKNLETFSSKRGEPVLQSVKELYYIFWYMCPTLSVRLSDHLKEGMDRLKDRVDWSDEIRRFIEKKIEDERKRAVLRNLETQIAQLPRAAPGTASRLVRGDRDSH